MQPIRVGIADDNQDFCQLLQDYFSTRSEIEVVATAYNGLDIIKIFPQITMDVLLLDMIMPQMDGLGVLQWLREHSQIHRPKIIIFSAFGQEEIARNAVSLGVDYYVLKPFDLETLTRRICEVVKGMNDITVTNRKLTSFSRDLELEVSRIIQSLNIPLHFKGYSYLRDAIIMTSQDPSLINEVTKRLYPLIAEQYHTTMNRVERAMRFAIETAWNKGDVQTLHNLFGYCVDDKKGKPTNASFIAKIADKMRLEKNIRR
ncbi:MAG TPA: sporulation transcription factor Spo0A [Firmicutes bacterium]|jgi:two-component system, response regulator, stage 0 sporulation protein A|nr:sporulation transcription factor Spo0A [Bacillota bacterium]